MRSRRSIWRFLAALTLSVLVGACSGTEQGDPFANCGNGTLDAGEQCDDGNLMDNDACLSTCVKATCGDGFIDLAHEACDGLNTKSCGENHALPCTCDSFLLGPGTLEPGAPLPCTSACEIDTSWCGPAITPTPVRTPTATATAKPTPHCGNGVIEAGEACDTCAADCVVQPCAATTPGTTVSVALTIPPSQNVTGLTILLGYRSSVASLPGSGLVGSVAGRVKNKPANTIVASNDLDYALRVVLSRSNPIPAGQIFTVDFDDCDGTPPPAAADFGCSVEGCANTNGPVHDCACEVSVP